MILCDYQQHNLFAVFHKQQKLFRQYSLVVITVVYLLQELSEEIEDYTQRFNTEDQLEWNLVLQEVAAFVEVTYLPNVALISNKSCVLSDSQDELSLLFLSICLYKTGRSSGSCERQQLCGHHQQ